MVISLHPPRWGRRKRGRRKTMANIGQRLLLLLAAALMVAAMAMLTAGPALAQLTEPHQHILTVEGTGEEHQVAKGTGKCTANLTALNNFHTKVHTNLEHPLSDNLEAAQTKCEP
jgi:hypothetical protein